MGISLKIRELYTQLGCCPRCQCKSEGQGGIFFFALKRKPLKHVFFEGNQTPQGSSSFFCVNWSVSADGKNPAVEEIRASVLHELQGFMQSR